MHNRTGWCDFPSLCSSAPCCYRKQRLIFFPPFCSIFPHQDEFYQQLQAIRQPWHIPSDTDSDIMEPPEQDKSEWPTWCFLPPEVCFFFYTPLYCLFFLISFPFFAETENTSVSADLCKAQFRGWWPKDLRSLKKTNTSRQEKCFQETIEQQTQCPNTCCYLCIICLFLS